MAITLKTNNGYAILAKNSAGKIVDVGYRYKSEKDANDIIELSAKLAALFSKEAA